MKKKHIQYRSGLLIGLLGLSTLSSCMHASRGLSMGGGWSDKNKNGNNNVENGSNGSQTGGKYDKIKDAAWSAGKVGVGYAFGYATKAAQDYFQSGGTGSNSTGYNSTSTTTSNPWGGFKDPK